MMVTLLAVIIVSLTYFFNKKLRDKELLVSNCYTPLSSIIRGRFLISAPFFTKNRRCFGNLNYGWNDINHLRFGRESIQ